MKSSSDMHSLGCTGSWASIPLYQEIGRLASWSLTKKDDFFSVSQMLQDQNVEYGLCSVDRILMNLDFELALPVGVVVHGSSSLAYFTDEYCEELKKLLKPRIDRLKGIFENAHLPRSTNMREAARFIWSELECLEEPAIKRAPYVEFSGGCGLFTSLARVMYRLLFGEVAYETNLRMQTCTKNGSFQNSSDIKLEFRQGNDALARKCKQRNMIDLVETWLTLTGMPFVCAVIQKCQKSSHSNGRLKIIECAEMAQAKMKIDPVSYLPDVIPMNSSGQNIDLAAVWKTITYRLNSEDMKSLLLFLNLARPLQKNMSNEDKVSLKLLRWQQSDTSGHLLLS